MHRKPNSFHIQSQTHTLSHHLPHLLALTLAALLGCGLWLAQPAAAQPSDVAQIGYGQTQAGEIDSPNGAEHTFTGCVDETVGITVSADDFAPRVELYAEGDDIALAHAVAAAGESSATVEGIVLPTTGNYTLVISGRTRGDRGPYEITLEGSGLDNPLPDEGSFQLNLQYGDSISESLDEEGAVAQWFFRGCAGDEISAEIDADGFSPQLRIFHPVAERALATAEAQAGEESVTLNYELKVNGPFNLITDAQDASDTGDFTLNFALEGRNAPIGETPTVISELSPTPTPTASGGPRTRRGIPTPRASTTPTRAAEPTATFTPTPTPEYEMPGIGEGVFTVIDVNSDGGPVNFAAYAMDGSIIATAGEDGAVRVWDSFTGELLQTLRGHEERVNKVAFAPDDELLASASVDGSVRLWNQAGRPAATLELDGGSVLSVGFSPDSAAIVATTEEGNVQVWDVAAHSLLFELEGNEGPVYDAVYSPDGSQIATGDALGVVRLWDASDGSLVDALPVNAGPGSGDPILSIAYSSDGAAIVVGGVVGVNDASVQIWDLASGDPIGDLGNHGEWGSTAVISPDDAHILSAQRAEPGHDGPVESSVYLWNTKDGELAIALIGYPNSVVSAAFRPDGDELLTSDGQYLYLWPGQMIDLFAASYGNAVGVQIPAPTMTPRPTAARATPTTASGSTPTPTLIPTATLTPTPEEPTPEEPTPEEPTPEVRFLPNEVFCTVTIDRLNLRPGPGTNYNPPIAVLQTGDLVVVNGRNEDSTWLQVDVVDFDFAVVNSGWISAEFVFCVGEIEDVPVVVVE